ncbi:monovalent cation:proton antiporter-2 (CPA2) family protein [Tropicimonas marinistellae]|uniref:monovalent cation:proton antiporter-2 (CPA2) family protein n=1 Tax=Tropicimonas marinistellae TaxID=1739787 RepID=UPI00082DA0A3|nr:monovalent cation:proton antiporter-2 (CPA2) family protein [Tropicimonas marinistellae]
MEFLAAGFVYLVAAVVAVPLANRLGLGSVLGYLIAGVVIGPVLGIVGHETVELQHFAEFGVVMMLFLVGLELQPAMLWRMRTQLLGLGGLQVVGTTVAIAAVSLAFGLAWQAALALGMILALSSTAIVLQTLNEKGWMQTIGGKSAFSVLLTQDIAVIPMLALMPLLAVGTGHDDAHGAEGHGHAAPTAFDALPDWAQALAILAIIAAIILAGRTVMRPVFRFIAEARLREIFTAAALMLVIGIALAMNYVGLSPALGTFLAGVVLSDSEYRHELESDIEPFKGLLLGLFFITVGAGVDFGLLFSNPIGLVGLAVGLMALKAALLYGLATAFGLGGADRWLFTLGLAQAGEFAFVLFGFTLVAGVLPAELVSTMTLVVALSMLLTPLLFILHEKVLAPRSVASADREPDEIDEAGTVVVAGIGRVGQIITRLLVTNGYKVTVLDHDPETIENLSKIGFRAYYGDATRPDLLHSAGLETAKLFVAALDDREKQTELVRHVAHSYPNVTIHARAIDRHHVYDLENAGAHIAARETFEGALSMGRDALVALGNHPFRAETARRTFRAHDHRQLDALRETWNTEGVSASYIDAMRAHSQTLFDLMKEDRLDSFDRSERGWTPPPKGDASL